MYWTNKKKGVIYYTYMDFDPDELDNPTRNQFILSKGHNGILLYTIFCDMGMYDWDLLLDTYNTIGHPFSPHPNRKRVKGIEVSTGSLGHGLSWASGIAHANRNKDIKSRIFCMLGDGEMEEGSNWEAILYAASKKLDNIVAVVDFNHCSAAFETGENMRWGEKGGPEGMADYNSVQAAMKLQEQGYDIGVIDMHTIKPIDKEAVIAAVKATGKILTVEDHNVLGGLGARVADVLMEEGVPAKVKKIGVPDCFAEFGYPEELYPYYGLDIDGIVKTALEFLK